MTTCVRSGGGEERRVVRARPKVACINGHPVRQHVACYKRVGVLVVHSAASSGLGPSLQRLPKEETDPCSAAGADDVHWYPLFLARQRFKGIFAFRQTTQLVWFDVRQVHQLAEECWWEQQQQQQQQQQATGAVTPGSKVSLA